MGSLEPRLGVVQVAFTREALEVFLELLNNPSNRIISAHGCRVTFDISFYEPNKATFFVEEHCDG